MIINLRGTNTSHKFNVNVFFINGARMINA
jgi:hypothetical protein